MLTHSVSAHSDSSERIELIQSNIALKSQLDDATADCTNMERIQNDNAELRRKLAQAQVGIWSFIVIKSCGDMRCPNQKICACPRAARCACLCVRARASKRKSTHVWIHALSFRHKRLKHALSFWC